MNSPEGLLGPQEVKARLLHVHLKQHKVTAEVTLPCSPSWAPHRTWLHTEVPPASHNHCINRAQSCGAGATRTLSCTVHHCSIWGPPPKHFSQGQQQEHAVPWGPGSSVASAPSTVSGKALLRQEAQTQTYHEQLHQGVFPQVPGT